jgi:hypothetical protein
MSCPNTSDWDLLAMEALEADQAEELLTHARACPQCRARYEAARRDHIQRVRMYEAFDRQHDELREQLMAALPADGPARSSADPLVRGWHRLGDCFMLINKSAPRRIAAVLLPAACVLLAVLLLVHPGVQKSAFAAAIERFQRARTIVCRISMPEGLEVQGVRLQAEGKLYISDEYGSYSTISMNGMEVTRSYAPVTGPMIIVQPITRTYMKLDVSEVACMDMQEQTPAAFVDALRKLTDGAATELPPQMIEGQPAIGYHIPGEKLGFPPPRSPDAEAAYAELWVDSQTRLPVKFMLSMPMPDQDMPLIMMYDQFEWDVPLEPSLFEPQLGEDYTEVDARLARPSEAALLNALRLIAKWTDEYPPDLSPVSVLGRLHTMVPESKLADFDKLGQAGLIRLGVEIGGGTMYYMKLVREGHEPEYFGDQVTPADADKVLMRWKLDDGHTRVIYGDLRAETLE